LTVPALMLDAPRPIAPGRGRERRNMPARVFPARMKMFQSKS